MAKLEYWLKFILLVLTTFIALYVSIFLVLMSLGELSRDQLPVSEVKVENVMVEEEDPEEAEEATDSVEIELPESIIPLE